MKKIFLFAAAAVTMAAGCQKLQEILVNPNDKPVDDDSPVLVTLGTNVAATSTTKAALGSIEDLKKQNINVYGLLAEAVDLTKSDAYLLRDTAATTGEAVTPENFDGFSIDLSKTNIPSEAINTEKYYGSNNEVYNFYGYYVGAARTADRFGTTSADAITASTTGAITIPVIIDGQDDILIAKTNKVSDLAHATDKSTKLERIYSAYSARRGVVPNLLFEHQLAQLTFKIENGGVLTDDMTLKVKSLKVKSQAKADIVITNNAGGELTPKSTDNDPVEFAFPVATDAVVASFTKDTAPQDLDGSIMVMPGKESYEAVVELVQTKKVGGNDTEITDSKQNVSLSIDLKGTETFKAGYSYEVTMKIYPAQVVLVDVTLVDWKAGESIYVDNDSDPDETPAADDTKLYAVPVYSDDDADKGKMIFEVNVPETGYYNVQAALSETTTAPETGWIDLALDTKASSKRYAVFTDFNAETMYYCHLRYKEQDGVGEYNVGTTPTEPAVSPSFEILKSVLITDQASYTKELPKSYTDKYPTPPTDQGANNLPWLYFECTSTTTMYVEVYKDGEFVWKKEYNEEGKYYHGLMMSGDALGFKTTLPAGDYLVKVNGESCTIKVITEE